MKAIFSSRSQGTGELTDSQDRRWSTKLAAIVVAGAAITGTLAATSGEASATGTPPTIDSLGAVALNSPGKESIVGSASTHGANSLTEKVTVSATGYTTFS